MEEEDKYRLVSFYHSMDCENTLDSDLCLKSCGIENCVSGSKYGPCVINAYHIYIVLSGKGVLCIGKRIWQLTAGMIFVLPDGLEAEYEADQRDPWQYAWIIASGKNVALFLKDAGFSRSPVRKCNCNPEYFVEIINSILETREQNLSGELRRNSYLYEILALLVETSEPEKHDNKDSQDVYVRNAVEYIQKNYAHIKVHDIAVHVGINRSYLTTLFKNKLDMSPQEYLIDYRLNQAKQLLQTTNLCVHEVAYRVGYENPLTFSKMFKNVYGVSPKHYRQSHQFVI